MEVQSQFIEMFGESQKYEVTTVDSVCSSIVRGPFGSALKVSYFVPQGSDTIKVYEQKNAIQNNEALGDSFISKSKYSELKRFSCGPGDILMSCSGTIGCMIQLSENAVPGIINQALCKFTLNNKILPEYFLFYMRHSVDQMETKGSAMKNIGSVKYIKAMPLVLPEMSIQEQFVMILRQVDKSKFVCLNMSISINRAIKSLINN